MKIAVPVTSENQIDGHFGHCDSYGVFTISDRNEITDIRSVEPPQGCGCKSEIGSVLSMDGVTIMLAGGIGDGAVNKLNNSGIEVIRGCSGNAREVVELFISGLVEDTGSSCNHHGNHDEHHNQENGQGHAHRCSHDDHDHGHHEHGHDHAQNCGCGGNHDHGHKHEHDNDLAHNCGCN
jgi:predicted Fe-Mo cluster-binding NifX family protein